MIGDLIRSGKAARDEILFVDLEDLRLDGFQPDDIARLLSAFHKLSGKAPRYLFFDEVHRLPSWSRILRTLHSTRKYAIVITGSNTKVLASGIATELRGKYEDCLILPFSFREFLSFFDTVFHKDVLDRYGIRARHLLDLVMRNMLESYASLFSISGFAGQLKSHGLPGANGALPSISTASRRSSSSWL